MDDFEYVPHCCAGVIGAILYFLYLVTRGKTLPGDGDEPDAKGEKKDKDGGDDGGEWDSGDGWNPKL